MCAFAVRNSHQLKTGDTTYIEGAFMIFEVRRDLNVAILAEIIDWDYIHKFNLLAKVREARYGTAVVSKRACYTRG